MITIEDSYKILDKYFKQEHILVRHQHESFDYFLGDYIPSFLMKEQHIFYEQFTRDKIYRNKFEFSNVRIKPPVLDGEEELMFPWHARINSLTYSCKIIANVKQFREVYNLNDNTSTTSMVGVETFDVPIAKIPLMVKSKYCNVSTNKDNEYAKRECDYDHGSYFIVNGSEKIVMSLERIKTNQPYVFYKKDQNIKILMATIHSQNYQTNSNIQIFSIKMKKDNLLELNISQFNNIPIFILIKALGLETEKDIINAIVGNNKDTDMINLLRVCLEVSALNINKNQKTGKKNIYDADTAQKYMIEKMKTSRKYTETDEELKKQQKKMHLLKILSHDILPHMGTDLMKKAYYICYMVRKLLLCSLNRENIDDRDSYINKRIDTPGQLLILLFNQNFKKMLSDCRKQFENKGGFVDKDDENYNPPNVIYHIKSSFIEQGIRTSLSKGMWGGSKNKKGVAQNVNRLSYIVFLSSCRKVVAPTSDASTSKLIGPRLLDSSQDGVLCPYEVPEGEKAGLVKNLSLIGRITIPLMEQIDIIKNLISKKIISLEKIKLFEMTVFIKIFLNGEWLGITKDPFDMMNFLKESRIKGVIDKTVSISFNSIHKEIHIYCDGGRLYRPMYVVKNSKLALTKEMMEDIEKLDSWNSMMLKYPQIIEYVDIEELYWTTIALEPSDVERNYQIKMNKISNNDINIINRYDNSVYLNYTHCELHPSMKLGVCSSTIPYANRNQSPRCIYEYAQMKQSMSLYSTAYLHRVDLSNLLFYSQVPIITTKTIKYTNQDIMTYGENIIVAIMSYTGSNMEDSLIFNDASIKRGLFRAMVIKKEKDEITSNQTTSQHDIYMKPTSDLVSDMIDANYNKLNTKGYVPENVFIEPGDAIIGKCTPNSKSTKKEEKPYRDISKFCKEKVQGIVGKVYDNLKNNEGYDQLLMRLYYERIPKIGDKFSSRHSQKGTIGLILREEDMPFTADGLKPDIIVSPNGLPGRMTMGQIMEMVACKLSVVENIAYDGTIYNYTDIEELKDKLEELGFNRNGTEVMYNGFTGEKITEPIFICPIYYQRLKHMVDDKIHSRSIGTKQLLTRQPTEGRSRDGGLRLGEMERDSLIAHGISAFLKERLVECSDAYSCYVCDTCGFIASKMKEKEVYYCQSCSVTTNISKVNMPYAFKLLIQELAAMNIAARIRTQN